MCRYECSGGCGAICVYMETGRAQLLLLGSILLVFETGSVTEQELDKLARLADWPAS